MEVWGEVTAVFKTLGISKGKRSVMVKFHVNGTPIMDYGIKLQKTALNL